MPHKISIYLNGAAIQFKLNYLKLTGTVQSYQPQTQLNWNYAPQVLAKNNNWAIWVELFLLLLYSLPKSLIKSGNSHWSQSTKQHFMLTSSGLLNCFCGWPVFGVFFAALKRLCKKYWAALIQHCPPTLTHYILNIGINYHNYQAHYRH